MTTETLVVTDEHTTLDLLLFRRFGAEHPGLVEDTLRRNPALALAGPLLPLGRRVVVALPAPPTGVSVRTRRLWG